VGKHACRWHVVPTPRFARRVVESLRWRVLAVVTTTCTRHSLVHQSAASLAAAELLGGQTLSADCFDVCGVSPSAEDSYAYSAGDGRCGTCRACVQLQELVCRGVPCTSSTVLEEERLKGCITPSALSRQHVVRNQQHKVRSTLRRHAHMPNLGTTIANARLLSMAEE